jgi:hypothetical protein
MMETSFSKHNDEAELNMIFVQSNTICVPQFSISLLGKYLKHNIYI